MNLDLKTKIKFSIIKLPLQFLANLIIPRILGVDKFGQFEFLNSIGIRLINFLEAGSLNAFYVKYSKTKNKFIIGSYLNLFLGIASFILLIVYLLKNSNIYNLIWNNNNFRIVLYSIILALNFYFINFIQRIFDSNGEIRDFELKKTTYYILYNIILGLILYLNFKLNLEIIYFIQIFLSSIYLIKLRSKIKLNFNFKSNLKYIKYSTKYSSPLLLYLIISTISEIFGIWYLQKSLGNYGQGIFGLSNKFILVITTILASIIPIFTREFAFLNSKLKLNYTFLKGYNLLIFITGIFGIFILLNSELIILLIGGKSYSASISTLKIMGFIPIFQILGQLIGSYYYSKELTKIYGFISTVFSIFYLIISYLLIGNNKFYQFNFGINGLAISLLTIQFLRTNTLIFWVFKQNILLLKNLYLIQIRFIFFILIQFTISINLNFNIINSLIYSILSVSLIIYIFYRKTIKSIIKIVKSNQ